MAAPCRAHDKKHFPGADVVRVGSQRWLTQPQHKETLDELVAEAAGFVEAPRSRAPSALQDSAPLAAQPWQAPP